MTNNVLLLPLIYTVNNITSIMTTFAYLMWYNYMQENRIPKTRTTREMRVEIIPSLFLAETEQRVFQLNPIQFSIIENNHNI